MLADASLSENPLADAYLPNADQTRGDLAHTQCQSDSELAECCDAEGCLADRNEASRELTNRENARGYAADGDDSNRAAPDRNEPTGGGDGAGFRRDAGCVV